MELSFFFFIYFRVLNDYRQNPSHEPFVRAYIPVDRDLG